jgi:hypothetical protein
LYASQVSCARREPAFIKPPASANFWHPRF